MTKYLALPAVSLVLAAAPFLAFAQSAQSNCVALSHSLTLGSRGSDVAALQAYLIQSGLLDAQYSTGYYGFLTASAVGKAQVKLGIVSSENDTAYGIAGPRTRAALSCAGSAHPTNPTANTTPTTPGSSAPLTASCVGSPYDNSTHTTTWHVDVLGGSGTYSYQWNIPGISWINPTLGGLQTNAAMVQYASTGTKQASVVVSDGKTSTTATCSATISEYGSVPTGSESGAFNPQALDSLSSTPTLWGSATNASTVGISIGNAGGKVYGSGPISVRYIGKSSEGGTWSVTVSPALANGNYIVQLYGSSDNLLSQQTLVVHAPTTTTPSGQPDLTATVSGPSTAYAGQQVTVSGTVTNIGTAGTGGSFPGVFVTNLNAGATDWNTKNVVGFGPLGAGQSFNTSTTLSWSTPGTYDYAFCADSSTLWAGSIAESNENNNCSAHKTITILSTTIDTTSSNGTICTNAVAHRGQGGTYTCTCPTNFSQGAVWGSGPYSDDSNICAAALYAGVITTAGGGVRYTMMGPQSSFTGGTANGVTTQSYGSWPDSYSIQGSIGSTANKSQVAAALEALLQAIQK